MLMEDPVKSLRRQNEISEYIQNLNIQAKNLQDKAARVLEEAKKQVEQMIIGE